MIVPAATVADERSREHGPLLTLLTDFGTTDYYAAAVKGTVLRLAPGSTLVDISHEVPPGDVEAASFLLAASAPAFPSGTVHLAVVDPGVGSERCMLAVETTGDARAGGAVFLAPDNGLLTPVLLAPSGPSPAAVYAVERADLFLAAPGSTFHGRDRFAPAAAFLLRGGRPAELGPPVADPVLLPFTLPRRQGRTLTGRVVHVDRFGNLVTDIPSAWLPAGTPFRAEVAGRTTNHRATHYREIPPGEAAVVPGSLGTLELSEDGADLARRWGARRGDPVRIDLG